MREREHKRVVGINQRQEVIKGVLLIVREVVNNADTFSKITRECQSRFSQLKELESFINNYEDGVTASKPAK